AAFKRSGDGITYGEHHFIEQVLVFRNIEKPILNRGLGEHQRSHHIRMFECGKQCAQGAIRMADQVCFLDMEGAKQSRQVMRVHKCRMIGNNRTVYIGKVITAAIKNDTVAFREQVELRQPLAVILETPVDENHGGPTTFIDVMKFDVTVLKD